MNSTAHAALRCYFLTHLKATEPSLKSSNTEKQQACALCKLTKALSYSKGKLTDRSGKSTHRGQNN